MNLIFRRRMLIDELREYFWSCIDRLQWTLWWWALLIVYTTRFSHNQQIQRTGIVVTVIRNTRRWLDQVYVALGEEGDLAVQEALL
jgi:hypothetical protein